MSSSPLIIILLAVAISVFVGLFIKSRMSKRMPTSLPQLFVCWKKQSLINTLKNLSIWAFFLYTFSPILLSMVDVMTNFELGYIDYLDSILSVSFDDITDLYPVFAVIEEFFLTVGILGAIMSFLKEAALKDLSSYLIKTPIANELIISSGDAFSLNPSISFAHTSNVFKDIRGLHTAKMIFAPITSFITAMCFSSFVVELITYSIMQSLYPGSSDGVLTSVFLTPAVFVGSFLIITCAVLSIVLSKKARARMDEARVSVIAHATSYNEPPIGHTYTAETVSDTDFDGNEHVNNAFGASKNDR